MGTNGSVYRCIEVHVVAFWYVSTCDPLEKLGTDQIDLSIPSLIFSLVGMLVRYSIAMGMGRRLVWYACSECPREQEAWHPMLLPTSALSLPWSRKEGEPNPGRKSSEKMKQRRFLSQQ